VVRANYGRFSLEVCNTSGNTSWSFNCIQHATKAVLDRRCSNLPECSFPVTSELFGGDPCPGTGKYIEVRKKYMEVRFNRYISLSHTVQYIQVGK